VEGGRGKRHRFVMAGGKVRLRVLLRPRRGDDCGGKRFVVTVGDRDIEGATTAEGLVDVEVPASAVRARLRVWLEEHREGAPSSIDREVSIGHLDPVDTLSGVQARLANLGLRCPISGVIAPLDLADRTLAAVRAFRETHGLPPVDPPATDAAGDDAGPTEAAFTQYVEQLVNDSFRATLVAVYETKGG